MQKNHKKAYILIWAIFLSLIISVTFIEISTKVNKNLNNNNEIIYNWKIDIETEKLINMSIINQDYSEKSTENWDKIIFDNNIELIFSMKKDDINLSKINNTGNISISILQWWPIKYNNNTLSGIINNTGNIATTIWELYITNLSWYTKLKINSISNNYLSKYTNYKITRKIWNKEFIKSKWKIKNF